MKVSELLAQCVKTYGPNSGAVKFILENMMDYGPDVNVPPDISIMRIVKIEDQLAVMDMLSNRPKFSSIWDYIVEAAASKLLITMRDKSEKDVAGMLIAQALSKVLKADRELIDGMKKIGNPPMATGTRHIFGENTSDVGVKH